MLDSNGKILNKEDLRIWEYNLKISKLLRSLLDLIDSHNLYLNHTIQDAKKQNQIENQIADLYCMISSEIEC